MLAHFDLWCLHGGNSYNRSYLYTPSLPRRDKLDLHIMHDVSDGCWNLWLDDCQYVFSLRPLDRLNGFLGRNSLRSDLHSNQRE